MTPQSASPAVILSADWAKEGKKRSVWFADVQARLIRRSSTEGSWTLSRLLEAGLRLADRGSVLVAIDAVLGVPAAYFARRSEIVGWELAANFLEWLPLAARTPGFFVSSNDPARWSIASPFISVPKGEGTLSAFRAAAGFDLRRNAEQLARGNPCFITRGIPGSVGSGTCELWRELAPLLALPRAFRVWPFEGPMDRLLTESKLVLAEMYPRAAYAIAAEVGTGAPKGKGKPAVRSRWISALDCAPWIGAFDVRLHDLPQAAENEDDFDALFAAAALLRRVLERSPLMNGTLVDDVAEGGILLSGAPTPNAELKLTKRVNASAPRPGVRPASGSLRCPIPGCSRVFRMYRFGWDSHVASARLHPDWLPKITDPHERKARFREDFSAWFGPAREP